MPALPLTCGMLEKKSYGVLGANGEEPDMNAGASGANVPGPLALRPTKVMLASVTAWKPSGRGVGVGDGGAEGPALAAGVGDGAASARAGVSEDARALGPGDAMIGMAEGGVCAWSARAGAENNAVPNAAVANSTVAVCVVKRVAPGR